MVAIYPVSVERDYSRAQSRNAPAKRADYNRVADRVEAYINEHLKDEPDGLYGFDTHEITRELREDHDLVHRAVFSLDCGHNGVTVRKGKPLEPY